MPKPNPVKVLKTKMLSNDVGAKTVKQYLLILLSTLWNEGESFSGKRPFGNSGWEGDLYAALVKAKLVKGDEDLSPDDEFEAHGIIAAAIKYLSTH